VHSYTVIAAACGVFSFLFGFMMMRYVVFTESQLKGRVQFFRYGLSALISATVNWILIKLMVDTFAWNASLCNVFASVVVVTISYFLQRKFSFK
jgi:putative flippase GtrA